MITVLPCELSLGVQGPVEYDKVLEKLLPSNWDIAGLQGNTIFVHDKVWRTKSRVMFIIELLYRKIYQEN